MGTEKKTTGDDETRVHRYGQEQQYQILLDYDLGSHEGMGRHWNASFKDQTVSYLVETRLPI